MVPEADDRFGVFAIYGSGIQKSHVLLGTIPMGAFLTHPDPFGNLRTMLKKYPICTDGTIKNFSMLYMIRPTEYPATFYMAGQVFIPTIVNDIDSYLRKLSHGKK